MGGTLVKCSGGAGGIEALKGRSRASLASQLPQEWGGFSAGEKKGLAFARPFSILVPRGRLELPLLSKTDFESAASTNSAIRAMAAEYREVITVGQSGT
jgi:hypothetical protein